MAQAKHLNDGHFDDSPSQFKNPFGPGNRADEDHGYLLDLIHVLRPHPAGLRRWSVMRAIRKRRELAHLAIPQRMEDAIERVFRNGCADAAKAKAAGAAPETALFHWPQGKAAGLWAIHADRADAWLNREGRGGSL